MTTQSAEVSLCLSPDHLRTQAAHILAVGQVVESRHGMPWAMTRVSAGRDAANRLIDVTSLGRHLLRHGMLVRGKATGVSLYASVICHLTEEGRQHLTTMAV